MKPKQVVNLEKTISLLCSVGKKSSQKMVFQLIKNHKKEIKFLLKSLEDCQDKIINCRVCNILTNQDICPICLDEKRENTLIVVATSLDAWHLEELKIFNGKYHILGGEINISKNIHPEKLNIETIIDRVNDFSEIIISTNPTLYGELTANYIIKMMENHKIQISRLANGIPVGGKIDYIDELTLKQAFKNRIKED